MNVKKVMVAAALQLILLEGAQAQNCTASAGALTGTGVVSVDTCASTNQLTVACNGLTPIGNSVDTIYSLQVSQAPLGGISVTPTGYDVYVALMQGTCSGGSTCLREADNAALGGQEYFSLVGLPAGTYYMLLTSFSASPPNCGSTTIILPPVPVSLQRFSVE